MEPTQRCEHSQSANHGGGLQGWQNVQALNIKTVDSIALPVFSSVPQQKLKIDAA